MTESTTRPDLANAQKVGGGGPEPDLEEQPVEHPAAPAGEGVDLKSSELPDPEE